MRTNNFILIFIATVSTVILLSCGTSSDYFMSRAAINKEKGNLDSAAIYMEKAHAADPENAGIVSRLSELYIERKEYKKALGLLNNSLKVIDSDSLLVNRGEAKYFLHQYDSALDDLLKAIKKLPEDAKAFMLTGFVYTEKGEDGKSLQYLQMAQNADPGNPLIYFYIGTNYFRKNKFAKALDEFNKAIDLDNTKYDFYDYRASCWLALYNFDNAVKDYNKAAGLAPENFKAYAGLGDAFLAKGELKDAMDNYSKAISLAPENPEGYNGLAKAYLKQNNSIAALGQIQKSLEIDPDNIETLLIYSDYFISVTKIDEAEKNIDRILLNHNDNYKALARKGIISAYRGDYKQAVEYFNQAIDIHPEYAYALYQRGINLNKLRKYDAAIEDLKLVRSLDPQYKESLIELIIAYLGKKDYDKAAPLIKEAFNDKDFNEETFYHTAITLFYDFNNVEYTLKFLDQSISMNNEYYPAYYLRGLVYMNKNKKDAARADFEKYLSLAEGKPGETDNIKQVKDFLENKLKNN